jgi:type I restriction enzyme S subunit
MAGEWRASTWGEEISLEYGKSLRDYRNAGGKFRVFGSNGAIGWTEKPLASGPGVILGRKGAYRGVEFSRHPFFVIDTAYYVVPKNDLDMRWLYYAIKHHQLGEIDDGSPIPSTTRSAVYVRELEVPPLPTQRAIAHIIGTLDDLIELNRETNEILEEMARALFKSWFVDFDPVRAKLEGRPPAGMDAATAALFPDHFQDSELGQIPKGWEVKPVGHIAEQSIGGQWGDDLPVEDLVPAICLRGCDMEDLRKSGFSARAPTRFIKPQALEKRAMDDCDFLIASSGAGPCGRPLWCSPDLQKMHQHPVIYSNFVKRFTTPSRAHAIFLDRLFQEKFTNGSIWDYINGTSVPNLDAQGLLSGHKFVLPPVAILKAFAAYCGPVFELLYSGESRDLATLRDTLLPKLLSGEVSAPAAEELIAAST